MQSRGAGCSEAGPREQVRPRGDPDPADERSRGRGCGPTGCLPRELQGLSHVIQGLDGCLHRKGPHHLQHGGGLPDKDASPVDPSSGDRGQVQQPSRAEGRVRAHRQPRGHAVQRPRGVSRHHHEPARFPLPHDRGEAHRAPRGEGRGPGREVPLRDGLHGGQGGRPLRRPGAQRIQLRRQGVPHLGDYGGVSLGVRVLWASVLSEAQAHGDGQDAREVQRAKGCPDEAAHGGTVAGRWAPFRGDGEGLPDWVRGEHVAAGEADDLERHL